MSTDTSFAEFQKEYDQARKESIIESHLALAYPALRGPVKAFLIELPLAILEDKKIPLGVFNYEGVVGVKWVVREGKVLAVFDGENWPSILFSKPGINSAICETVSYTSMKETANFVLEKLHDINKELFISEDL